MKNNLKELKSYLKGALFTGIFVDFSLGLLVCFIYSVVSAIKGNSVNFFKLMDLIVLVYISYVSVVMILSWFFVTHKKLFGVMLREGYGKKFIKFLSIIKWD